ncbi:DoxX family protein [bacterium]|nr:DoxX family protein [bacterium]
MQKLNALLKLWDRLLVWAVSLPALATRMTLGFGFYLTGKGKLEHLDNLVAFFNELHIPLASYQAPMVARIEYYGAILLLIGLYTRFSALLLAGTMMVALMTADKADFLASWSTESEKVPTEITAYAYLLLLLWLVVNGGGVLSLDALCNKLFGLRKSEPTT